MSIEDDIKRCEQLIKPENASWIGLSNQSAISHILKDYTMLEEIEEEHKRENGELRKKVKELEEENSMLRKSNNIAKDVKIEDITQLINKSYKEFMNEFIPKQKVKNIMEKEKLPLTIVDGRNNSKTLAYGIKLGKIKACEELLQESENK